MENIEKNEIITTEAIEDITEATSNGGSALKTMGIIGLGVLGAVILTRFVLLPAAREIKGAIQQKGATEKAKDAEAIEVDLDDMYLDDIPEVE